MEYLWKRSYICLSKSVLNLNKRGGGGFYEIFKNFILLNYVYLLFKILNIIYEM